MDENGNYIKEITEDAAEAHAIALDKHAEPAVVGGLTNTLHYKWFDLSFMFSYQFGAYGYDNWAQKTEHGVMTWKPIYQSIISITGKNLVTSPDMKFHGRSRSSNE